MYLKGHEGDRVREGANMDNYIDNLIQSEKKHAVTLALIEIHDALYTRYISLLEAISSYIKQHGYDNQEVRDMEERADELHKAIRAIDARMKETED